jgi:hypothetical protein
LDENQGKSSFLNTFSL